MILSTDWKEYLHTIRKREIDIVFSHIPRTEFETGLEIGAGDGYQTTLLAPHVEKLVSSDLNFKRINDSLKLPGVLYQVIDADAIDGKFEPGTFDFIFSSNVLEHLRDPRKFLAVTQPMLSNDGFAVHIIPSRWIKVSYLLFFYPKLALLVLDRAAGKLRGKPVFRGANIDLENNINTDKKSVSTFSRFKKIFVPTPHGNFTGHIAEFIAYGRKQWSQMCIEAGYSIVSVTKGPAFSGYGFGLNSFRKIFEKLGVSSEHIFILKKQSDFERVARTYTNRFLHRGSFYERQKFIGDWMKKEKNAKSFIQEFRKDVGDPHGKKVLDVGFGNGIMLAEFARAGAKPYGLETETALLAMAEERLRAEGARIELKIYDGKTFPFADNMFDYAYSTSVLEHMSYPQEVIAEIARTLAPGGKFYLSFPNKYAPKESHTGLWFISWLPRPVTQFILRKYKSSPLEDWNLHFISFFTLKNMAKRAGLDIVYDVQGRTKARSTLKKILAKAGIHYGVLLKTVIIVLVKPHAK
ncbi:MAG TPA: methyltransferase domain-containing protein [Candidatus Nanoarchaeia archaeon]|nr:methyltransferase domain-containing protein [Candidatus Nanoarchaeia archaeon]